MSHGLRKKKRGEHVTESKEILDELDMDLAAKASPWLVSIISHHVPGKYRRPWLGVEVANLYSSNLEFLEHFMMKFPNISTGVVVAEVTEDSPASCSGIRPKDVIVECNRKVVSSKLQFFDVIWDMVGESVEFNILRESTGERFKLRLIVGDTTPDKFYKWRRPDWIAISKKQSMLTVTPDDYVGLRNPSLHYERIID